VRQHAAAALAGERRLFRELERNRSAATTWTARARLAPENQREDLARRALTRHFEHAPD
jgi:phage shock protein A